MARYECLVCGKQRGYRPDAYRHVREKHPGHDDRETVIEVGDDNVRPPPVSQQPLRSSRSTRNQEHNPAARNRAGLLDHDPTEGLPVRRFEYQTVRINQDATADAGEANNQASDIPNENYPWPEQPLPSFFSQLAPHNQELIRRARRGNTNPKISIWDEKTGSYIPGIELERREAARKAALSKSKSSAGADLHEDMDDDKPDEDAEDLLDADGMPEKRRKTGAPGSGDRIIEVKKWVPVPLAVAEKMPEPKYLADRRPGMESLYKGAYKATNGFGTLGDMVAAAMSNGATGYDLGEGGLARAQALLAPGSGSAGWNGGAAGEPDGATTPARKNIPPRRKKKGGPGRKPKNWKPESATTGATSATAITAENLTAMQNATTGERGDTIMKDTPAASGERIENTTGESTVQGEANTQDQEGDGEGEGSESETDGEGSEEGEIAPPTADEPVHEAVAGDVVPMEIETEIETKTQTQTETKTQTEMVMETVVEPAAVVAEPEGAPTEKKDDEEMPEVEEKDDNEEMLEVEKNPEDEAPAPDAAAATEPVVEQNIEVDEKAVEETKEFDVLGALEAALNQEAGQDS